MLVEQQHARLRLDDNLQRRDGVVAGVEDGFAPQAAVLGRGQVEQQRPRSPRGDRLAPFACEGDEIGVVI